MVETLCVSLSGPAFSLLLYENVRTKYDQEGFLLGEIVEKRTNSITDNDEQVTRIDRIIKVNSTIPCPKQGYFYDAAGRIDEKKINNFLGNQKTDQVKVVAWYKFKHCNAFKMTLREKVVHKQLSQHFASSQPELFTCCLLTASSSSNAATHLYSQTFLRYIEPTYQMLPMHIVNLSDPNNLYKSIEPSSDAFNHLVKSLRIDKKKTQGLNFVTHINEELQKCTEQVATNLAEAEKRLYDLQEEIRTLQEKLKNKENVDVNMVEVPKPDGNILENGSGDMSCTDGTNSKKDSPELVKGSNRGRKKSVRQASTRNTSRSPVKIEVNLDNVVNNRTRSRNMSAPQKSKN